MYRKTKSRQELDLILEIVNQLQGFAYIFLDYYMISPVDVGTVQAVRIFFRQFPDLNTDDNNLRVKYLCGFMHEHGRRLIEDNEIPRYLQFLDSLKLTKQEE